MPNTKPLSRWENAKKPVRFTRLRFNDKCRKPDRFRQKEYFLLTAVWYNILKQSLKNLNITHYTGCKGYQVRK